MQKTWRLEGSFESSVVARRSGLDHEEPTISNLAFLSLQIDRWLANPCGRQLLLDIYENIAGCSSSVIKRSRGYDLHRLIKTPLLHAFQRGDLAVTSIPHVGMIPVSREEQPPSHTDEPPARDVTPRKTWIEFWIIDEEGNPVPNVHYQLELPDGITRSGTSDGDGKSRMGNLMPSSCRIASGFNGGRLWQTVEFVGMEEVNKSVSRRTRRNCLAAQDANRQIPSAVLIDEDYDFLTPRKQWSAIQRRVRRDGKWENS